MPGPTALKYPWPTLLHGGNRSPAFAFYWIDGPDAIATPETVASYAVLFHNVQNSTNKTTGDTLHGSAFNIPGTGKGLAEDLGAGDLDDRTRNGPGINARNGKPAAYYGPVPAQARYTTTSSRSTH